MMIGRMKNCFVTGRDRGMPILNFEVECPDCLTSYFVRKNASTLCHRCDNELKFPEKAFGEDYRTWYLKKLIENDKKEISQLENSILKKEEKIQKIGNQKGEAK